jgi:chromosome segregation ATPase
MQPLELARADDRILERGDQARREAEEALARLRARYESAERALARHRTRATEFLDRERALQESWTSRGVEIAKLEAERDGLLEELTDLREKVSALQTGYDAERNALQERLKSAVAEAQRERQAGAGFRDRATKAEQDLEKAAAARAEQEAARAEQEAARAELEAEVARAAARLQDEIAASGESRRRLLETRQQLEDLQKEHMETRQELETERTAAAATAAELARVETRFAQTAERLQAVYAGRVFRLARLLWRVRSSRAVLALLGASALCVALAVVALVSEAAALLFVAALVGALLTATAAVFTMRGQRAQSPGLRNYLKRSRPS